MITSVFHYSNDRLGFMLFLAACVHAIVILGISFELEDRNKPKHRQQSLEIMVVRHPKESPKEEEQPDFLAQTSQAGGGEQDEKSRPRVEALSTPAPSPSIQPQQSQPDLADAKPPLQADKPRLTQSKSSQKTVLKQSAPAVTEKPKLTSAQLIASRDQQILQLTAELERKTQAYAKLPKRKAISASTKEYKYAAYLDAWRRKVERIGNLNYPDEAKRKKLYGNLIMHVAVKADGSIEQVRVLHSSGHKLLDDAAVRIVRLAAPFSPFPNEIRKETDILDITRTWQFLRSNQLYSK